MNQFKKGIKDIRNLKLSNEERRSMYTHIVSRPLPSPYTHSILFIFSRSWVSYSIASALIVVLIGGSAAVAAEQSVPGDILYPIKIKVTEPARDLLIQEPATHARWESEKASRRLEEATVLAERNELTPERSRDIEKRFQEHVEGATEAFTTLASLSGTSTAYDAEKEFDGSLAAYERSLRAVSRKEGREVEKSTSTENRKQKKAEKRREVSEIASSSDETTEERQDTSSLEKKIKEVRSKFREEELRSRSERNREEGESETNVSDHNGSPRQERDGVYKVQEEDKSDRTRPDSGE